MKNRAFIALSLSVLGAGCQKKAEGQTVAVVNDDEITASELNGELATVNAPANADKKQLTNQVLQSLIDRRLLTEQARDAGIDRSPEFIARQRRANDELLIGMLASRQADTGKLPTESEIAQFQAKQPQIFANREVWKLDQVHYENPKDPAVQAQIAQAKTLDSLIAVLTTAGIPVQRGTNKILTSAIPADITRSGALPAGEPSSFRQWPLGASAITSREPTPLTGAGARVEAVNLIRRQNSADFSTAQGTAQDGQDRI